MKKSGCHKKTENQKKEGEKRKQATERKPEMAVDIDYIMDLLDIQRRPNEQARGLEYASHVRSINVFLQPRDSRHNQNVWSNCARVLAARSDRELAPYFSQLFDWLRDRNSPGADTIYRRLLDSFCEEMTVAYQCCLNIAEKCGNELWLSNLTEFGTEYILDLLDKENEPIRQIRGRQLARSVKDLKVFLQPLDKKHNKNVWTNCARVVSDRSDDELAPYLVQILEWLQDMDWPGAQCILDRLNRYGKAATLRCAFNVCIRRARETRNTVWEENLIMLQ